MSSTRLLAALLISSILRASADEKTAAVGQLVPWLLEESAALRGIRFADVVAATSGRQIIPVDRKDADDGRILASIGRVLDAVLAAMNSPASPTRTEQRVNEMSSHFEDAIRSGLDAVPGFACDFPKTAAGKIQRSGYPDLRLEDKATKRIFYLDPKLYEQTSRASTFRTFYFEPKRETNKVNDDARHLIIGIAHGRDPTDASVRFLRWELIDLSTFRVRLKAEFEGSNADLYRPEAVVGRGGK